MANSVSNYRYPDFCIVLILCIALIPAALKANIREQLKVDPAPANAILNNTFTVKIRKPDGKWMELPTYLVKVDKVADGIHNEESASMAYFDFEGQVEVAVTLNNEAIGSARIRPLSYGISQEVKGKTLYFKLSKPSNLSVEFNGDIFHNLHLFANPIDSYVPKKKDKNLIYFGPGIHEIAGRQLCVTSGKTVYIAGGAILKGQIMIENAENVKVLGRGMIDQSIKMGIKIANSKNVLVDGIFATQCFTGGSEGVTIRNVKVISYYGWGDGMNVIASRNVLMDSVFNRNSDDCTTVYGTRFGFIGGCKNVRMQNSTLWADVAHPILIGTHGNTPNPEILEDLTYQNIDILDHKEAQMDYQGCLALNAGDSNLIRNVRFENIRIEDFRQGQLFNIRVFYNKKYCTSPGRGIENVIFKDIDYHGKNAEPSMVIGYAPDRMIKNLVFENLKINGTTISDDMNKPSWYKASDMARIFINDHTENIIFKK